MRLSVFIFLARANKSSSKSLNVLTASLSPYNSTHVFASSFSFSSLSSPLIKTTFCPEKPSYIAFAFFLICARQLLDFCIRFTFSPEAPTNNFTLFVGMYIISFGLLLLFSLFPSSSSSESFTNAFNIFLCFHSSMFARSSRSRSTRFRSARSFSAISGCISFVMNASSGSMSSSFFCSPSSSLMLRAPFPPVSPTRRPAASESSTFLPPPPNRSPKLLLLFMLLLPPRGAKKLGFAPIPLTSPRPFISSPFSLFFTSFSSSISFFFFACKSIFTRSNRSFCFLFFSSSSVISLPLSARRTRSD